MSKSILKTILKDNKTYTCLQCSDCGTVREIKGSPSNAHVERALNQPCRCSRKCRRTQHGKNWWTAFGLTKNPGIYGPMPWKRTSLRFRLKEAREAGLNCWYWVDEFTDSR